jgi:hypothetical protein
VKFSNIFSSIIILSCIPICFILFNSSQIGIGISINNGFMSIGIASIFLIFGSFILIRGREKRIEKFSYNRSIGTRCPSCEQTIRHYCDNCYYCGCKLFWGFNNKQ